MLALTIGTSVTLTAINDQPRDWIFSGWSGDCHGTASCVVVMSGDRAVSATFTRNQTPQDCLPYSIANLRIVDEGATGWLLTDGVSRMLILDNQTDAQSALALAQQYTNHCFIGRNNQRQNRSDYIVDYWEGGTGQPPPITNEDCLPYSIANLRIVDEGATGWLLTDGVSRMLILDNQTDAQSALALAQRHTNHCFIGRNNQRQNRSDYIVHYRR